MTDGTDDFGELFSDGSSDESATFSHHLSSSFDDDVWKHSKLDDDEFGNTHSKPQFVTPR
jgi:hypothetical protein